MTEIAKNNLDEDIDFEAALEQSFKKIHTGERVKGYVVSVNNNEAIVDVGTKHTGYVPLDELTDDPGKKPADLVQPGDELDLIVTKINDPEGYVLLSKRRVDELVGFENIAKAKEEGTILKGIVQNAVKGGLIVSCDGVRVFVPASQSGLPKEADMSLLLKQKVRVKITEVNRGRKRVVGSIRAVAQKERRERHPVC